jgi:2,4-dienoyl-CoA reductase-like NADH-dependent reductase (Old Yellow Enzyme family)
MDTSFNKDILFSNSTIGKLNLNNRLIVAPMTRISGTDRGLANERMKKYYTRYAEGGFSLVITEGLYTNLEHSQGYPNQPGIATPEQVESWREITCTIHERGAFMFAQLMDAGALSQYNSYKNETIAPSAIKPKGEQLGFYGGKGDFDTPRAMTKKDIDHVIHSFSNAAKNAKEAGFDGVEIHGANGYIIDQFITSYTNKREDEYGGSLKNRLRLATEVIQAVHNTVGEDFPVGIRLSQTKVNDDKHQWRGKEEAQLIFQTIEKQEVDYIHTTEFDAAQAAFKNSSPLSVLAKKSTNIPVIANGNLESPDKAHTFLERGNADFISLAKGALANPDWPQVVEQGKQLDEFKAEEILLPEAYIKDSELYNR